MAKIRAYKLAEELGIDRNEIVDRAASAGIELRNAMASLDDDVAAELRQKLGGGREKKVVTEQRVQRGSGAAVIRRRKRPEPDPVPEPEVAPPAEVGLAPEPAVVDAAAAELEIEEAPVEEPAAPAPESLEEPAAGPIAAKEAKDSAEADKRSGRKQASETPGPSRSGGPAGADRKGAGPRKLVREVVNLREQESLARQATGRAHQRRQVTIDPRTATSPRRKRRDALSRPAAAKPALDVRRVVRVDGTISVADLARSLGAKAPEVQRRLMALGTMVAINQTVDMETARGVAAEFDYEVQDVGFDESQYISTGDAGEVGGARVPRPPVITVMGHVDHGKTSLLDAIRNTNVVDSESGGITQHIGAYRTKVGDRQLTFIDTPGHAAFTEMRARGAKVTDIVILVVAATDGIMPQTVEAIEHSRAAEVPIVVAVNKCDLPNADPKMTRQRLMEHGLVPEEFGGETICVDVSATQGTNLDKLLEMVHLQAELLELAEAEDRRAEGFVLEAKLDRGRGSLATVLVQRGTLRVGDVMVSGTASGRVRSMEDENDRRLREAGPAVPVQVTGLSGVPSAGDAFAVVETERAAKEIVEHREDRQRNESGRSAGRPRLSLEEIFAQGEGGGVKELPVVIKADTQGSVEALRETLIKLSTDAVKLDVLLAGVGAVNDSDVMLARASGAIVVAFHVRPESAARRSAESQGVEIRTYQVIYDVVDDVKLAMEGLLPPTVREQVLGQAEVRETFMVPRIGTIAGSYVTEGNVQRNAECRLVRDGVQIYTGRVGSLKRFKDDVREVASGFECGIGIEGYNDVKVGDVIEVFSIEEEPATL